MSESSQKFVFTRRVENATLTYSDSVDRSKIWKFVFLEAPLLTIKYSEVGEAIVPTVFAFPRVGCHHFRSPADSFRRNINSQTVENPFASLRLKVSKSVLC